MTTWGLATPIIDVTVALRSGTFGANGYVTLMFSPTSQIVSGVTYSCNWYDEPNGLWSTSGCTTLVNADGSVMCTCNHLTSFAVLADISTTGAKPPISSRDAKALSVITCV